MHPLLSDVRRVPWYVATWLGLGLLMAWLLVSAGWADWTNALVFAIPMALVFGFVAASAYFVCRSLPFARRHFFLGLAAFGATSALSSLAWLAICQLWALGVRALAPESAAIRLTPALNLALFATGFGLYLFSLLAHDVLIAFETLRGAQEREAQSRLLAREAELQVLRTQINPHFLFNSLNSISALTSMDPAGARQMAIELAQFFRQTLTLSEKEKIPLGDEVALCQNFLAIEKVRFGDKLDAAWQIDGAAVGALLPPMLLQPLLENAIKHGIRDLVDGGTIAVQITVKTPWLYLSVHNPVDVDPSPTSGTGLGLKNLRERLRSIYADQARITWERTPGQFAVSLALPLEFESRPHHA
jgi:sensor histidine kinase YesM